MKKYLFAIIVVVIAFASLLSLAFGTWISVPTTNDIEPTINTVELNKPRAVLQSHTSYGPSIINKAYIENTTQIYGPFTANDNYFNKLIVYGPLDISKSEIIQAFIYGPAKVSSSNFAESLTIFGPLMARSCMFKNINATTNKVFIENSSIENLKILKDEYDQDKQQIVYLRGNIMIKSIEFESKKGLIFITSKNINLSNTNVRGAEVKEIFS